MSEDPHENVAAVDDVADTPPGGVTRRELFQIGNVLALPVLMGGMKTTAEAALGPLKPGPEIYQSIGVEPVINCRGTFTIIGASVELPEVRAAMEAACQYYVQLDELADAVGRRLAELTGAEWGMVSAGCAAGLKHVTAACVAGGNPEKLLRIPDLTGFDKTEVVIPRSSRSVYDHAIRNIGVKIIMVDTAEELEQRAQSADGDDLPLRRRSVHVGTAVSRERCQDGQAQEHPDPGGCGCRDADDSERSPAEGRDGRGVQRRQGDPRAAVRRAAAGPQGHPHVGVAGQFAAPWPGPRQQGRPRRNAWACWRPSRRG